MLATKTPKSSASEATKQGKGPRSVLTADRLSLEDDYQELERAIRRHFPNKYLSQYRRHAGETDRVAIAKGLAEELRFHVEHSGKRPPGYFDTIDALTDYILAEDHARGLKSARDASGKTRIDDEFPPLGYGAERYLTREIHDHRFTEWEVKRTKVCEGCFCKFIDCSEKKNRRVCSESCRMLKDARRKREEYNREVHGLSGEIRYKNDRQRQDLEYGFYSPEEMQELADRSEKVWEEDQLDWMSFQQDEKYDKTRLNGKRKPKFFEKDEEDDSGEQNAGNDYRPAGRNKKEREEERESSPVIPRTLAEVIHEPTFVNASKIVWPKEVL